ncbi:hypothetical protein [Herbaspirillum sp. SJZ107]|uniref:hypothetical protein n=1 Tax=Herbaspirillum sp. SJZ107 TaxID=2572881 RepID=UPI00115298B2|nr:hypothetical protein [Herbaspirillum sp. SJZ107]TQK08238.1 hypothetical protein FBX97_3551 [Herbaspirillum sp. SJZ107]
MDTSPVLPPEAAAFGISFDGRVYHYEQYSYDRLADALDYARVARARPGFREDPAPRNWKQWAGPTPEERLRMAAHGVVFEGGYYFYGPYRYDLLSAALDYARHEPGLGLPPA